MDTPQQTVEFVKVASAFATKAMSVIDKANIESKKAAEVVPEIVEKMVTTGAIDPELRKEAEEMLSSHAGALSLLGQSIDKIAALRATTKSAEHSLGAPVCRSAPAEPKLPIIIGAKTSMKRASDIAFHNALHGI